METLDIIVETPKGSCQKYDYDPKTKMFKLSKIMPPGISFPYDFGFIPRTKGDDNDPLDVIVFSDYASFPGCLLSVRIIGCIKAMQSKKKGQGKMIRNDRFIAIPVQSLLYKKIHTVEDLSGHFLKELEAFFINYNKLAGKKFKVLKIVNAKKARKMFEK